MIKNKITDKVKTFHWIHPSHGRSQAHRPVDLGIQIFGFQDHSTTCNKLCIVGLN